MIARRVIDGRQFSSFSVEQCKSRRVSNEAAMKQCLNHVGSAMKQCLNHVGSAMKQQ